MMLLEPFLSFPLPFNELVFGDFYFSSFSSLLDALHGLGDLMVSNKIVSLANLVSALIFLTFPFYAS